MFSYDTRDGRMSREIETRIGKRQIREGVTYKDEKGGNIKVALNIESMYILNFWNCKGAYLIYLKRELN